MAVSNEYIREKPRNIFIDEHNRITRSHHPHGLAVIEDTVRSGYEQMTSFCRYNHKSKHCTSEIVDCLTSKKTLSHIHYRWEEREQEDNKIYTDLSLSSKYSALLASVLRTVFPNIIIIIDEN